MAKKTKVLAYIRESSASESIKVQKNAIKKYCDAHNMEPEFYVDSSLESEIGRDGFREVQYAISQDNKSIVICFSLDRLSISLSGCLGIIQTWLGLGVRIISTSEELELGEENVELIYPFLSSIIKMDTQLLRDKRSVGIAKAKAEGKYKGRKEGTTKAKYQKAWSLYSKGLTIDQVAKSMGVSNKSASRYINRTRAEWMIEDFNIVLKLVAEENKVHVASIAIKENRDNSKYPILKFAWGDAVKLDDSDYQEVSRELVELMVRTFKADFPEARALNKAKIIDLIRGLESDDWAILKSLESVGESLNHPKFLKLTDEQKETALNVSTIREIQAGLRKRYKNKPTTKHLKECFGDQATKDLVIGDSYDSYDLMTFKNIIKTKKFKEWDNV